MYAELKENIQGSKVILVLFVGLIAIAISNIVGSAWCIKMGDTTAFCVTLHCLSLISIPILICSVVLCYHWMRPPPPAPAPTPKLKKSKSKSKSKTTATPITGDFTVVNPMV